MGLDETSASTIMRAQVDQSGEARMVDQGRWAEIRRLFHEERVSLSEIGRRLDVDRKTVRRSLRQATWHPDRRAVVAETLLTAHAEFVRDRAPQVGYSARILYQELRASRGYTGSYETVKRCVAPLREVQLHAERALLRFETPPGQQSQIDWGQATVPFRAGPVVVHVFVLTLGFSRRGFYYACADERLAQFLEAHERAFAHFGGHTREHLYDRPRTVCYADKTGRRIWNPTFKAFADYWGFEPRVCRPYRAQTKGKVESGVKYVKRNFLPGRTFVDVVDFQAQLDEWNATIADCRLHGTTHELPIARFERERGQLVPLAGQRGFQQEARVSRIVAEDYLVSLETNRYSVPFRLIGQRVEVLRRGDTVHIFHRDREVATHPVLPGTHQFCILPEPGPGASARTARQRRSTWRDPASPPRRAAGRRSAGSGVLRGVVRERARAGGAPMNPTQLERLREQLTRLRLLKSCERLDALLQEAAAKDLSYADFLDQVLSEEVSAKAEKNITMRTSLARFPFVKSLEAFDFTYQPSLDKKQIQQVATCHFIEHGENLLILGPPGVGKSHLAIGLGLKAIAQGYRVLFTTAAAMIATLTRALSENRLEDKLKLYTIPRLLIIDEIGYLPIDRTGANLFFQLISRRYEKGPMILTSNQSFGAWGEVFGDRVLATAILDRVLHHAITINIRGHSYRLKEKLKAGLVRVEEASATN